MAGFKHADVTASLEWIPKTVATRQPVRGEHTEWRLSCRIVCEEAPILLAVVLRTADAITFGRMYRHNASHEAHVSLAFMPYGWHTGDEVQINLTQTTAYIGSGARVGVVDGELKADPRRGVSAPVPSATTTTGAIWTMAQMPSLSMAAELVVVSKADTERTHGRWRVAAHARPGVPDGYGFLLTGRQSGTEALEPRGQNHPSQSAGG